MRKKVFICSPFRGDMEGNARKAAFYSRMACKEGYLPIAPHLLFPQFLNEGIEEKHTYRFTVYSLDCELNISANSMKRNFLKKAERHIIQKGSIVGEFE